MELYLVSGQALLFFLDGEIGLFEPQTDELCNAISQLFQCHAWRCFLWDAIVVDLENTCQTKATNMVEEGLQPIPMQPITHQICQKIGNMIGQYLPLTIRQHGYFQYAYCEYI